MNTSRSIGLKVTLILGASLFLSFSVGAGIRYWSDTTEIRNRIEFQNSDTQKRLEASLPQFLWNVDMVTVDNLLLLEMRSLDILAIVLSTPDQKMGFIRNKEQNLVAYAPYMQGQLIRAFGVTKTHISFKGENLAELFIYTQDVRLREENLRSLFNVMVQGILTAFLGILFTALGLRSTVLVPLGALTLRVSEFGKQLSGNFSLIKQHNELQTLSNGFEALKDALKDNQELLLKQIYNDELTGLKNRRQLLQDLANTPPKALMLVNIDDFKQINDSYGTQAGDSLLTDMAQFLVKTLDSQVYGIYKMPGDEYALTLTKDDVYKIDLETTAKNLCRKIDEEVFQYSGTPITITVTIGISILDTDKKHSEALYLEADMALKYGKKEKVPYFFHDSNLNLAGEMGKNINLARELKDALKMKRIKPFYQPILNNQTQTVEKYECLVRMIDTEGKTVSPMDFLPMAKKTKLYPLITQTVLEMAFSEFRSRHHQFSINLSIQDILDNHTRERIFTVLKANPETAGRCVFELLESEGVENYTPVREFISQVRAYGCKLAVDDFGSGYSNFAHILKLDVDMLKIDASLIKNIHNDPNAQIVTRTIVNFSKELGFKTIAEFVSEEKVYEKVLELGIDYSQGYFIGMPKENP